MTYSLYVMGLSELYLNVHSQKIAVLIIYKNAYVQRKVFVWGKGTL